MAPAAYDTLSAFFPGTPAPRPRRL
ncbi:MAG: hypothetical protein V8R40_04260 [Dysosmobacter sp.]